MQKLLSMILALAMILSLAACGQKAEPVVYSADDYIDQLYSGLADADLPVSKKNSPDPSSNTDPDIGDYVYRGYVLSDGVYAATYEDPEQTKLLRVHVMIDLNLARRDYLSSGAFAVSRTIAYFDGDKADAIGERLHTSDISTAGKTDYASQTGHYEYLVDTANNRIFLVFTLAQPES